LTTYADSSFFVSLHLIDAHSQEAWRRMSLRPAIWLTPLNRAEITHAVFLHVFWKKATPLEAKSALSAFEQNSAAGVWQKVSIPPGAFDRSIELTRRYGPAIGIRTLDSLHVACALELKAERFWTFDERQAKLAEAVGLDTRA
jgi:predicted nucleic acid-binding protein